MQQPSGFRMASSSSASFVTALSERSASGASPRSPGMNPDVGNSQLNMSSLTSLDDTVMLPLPSLKAPLVSAETLDEENDNGSLVEACKKIVSLEKECRKLKEELSNERRERETLQSELKRVQSDNQKATSLLCKYADWFFNVADPHLESVTLLPTNGGSLSASNHSAHIYGTTVVRSTNTTTDLL